MGCMHSIGQAIRYPKASNLHHLYPRIFSAPTAMLLFTTLLFASASQGSAGGRNGFSGDPSSSAGSTCTVCHAPDGAETPLIGVWGAGTIDAGTSKNFIVLMVGGPAQTAGINISAGGVGELTPVDTDLQLLGDELTHVGPMPFASGYVAYSFQYTAPNYDADVTLYVAGNSTNAGLDLLGDSVASTTHRITVQNGFEPPPEPPEPAAGELIAIPFASGLNKPVAIENAGDSRLFVVERPGVIKIVDSGGSVLPTPYLDISTRVDDTFGEQGLLGLAFHPQYSQLGYFYVYYTIDPGPGLDRTRVSRFSVSSDGNLADPESELILMEFEQPFPNHNGGDLNFGPSGYLHIASGDGGAGGDPQDNSQTTTNLLGKMLRIDVDTQPTSETSPDCSIAVGSNYSIPSDNAFADGAGGAGCDEIFALGVRNPWRFTFDSETQAMWIADVGQNAQEEINYLPPGSSGGLNLGWRCYEGSAEFNLTGCDRAYLPPVHTYSHATSGCSVTGGLVYRGARTPLLHGQYFFTDFCQPSIRALGGPPGDLTHRIVLPTGQLSAVSTFGEDSNGEMYVAELNTGSILRLDAVLPFGDVDGDGDIDFIDIVIIYLSFDQPAEGDDDRRDLDESGTIDASDLALLAGLCTRPMCAWE